jgi:thiol-disulfide isomerase/thioredoxin
MYVKKIIVLLLSIAVCGHTLYAQKSGSRFVLKGNVAGLSKGLLYLYYTNAAGISVKDSTVLQNGGFSFTGNVAEPSMAYISLQEHVRNDAHSVNLFIEPATMTIMLPLQHFRDAVVTGSRTQEEYAVLLKSKKPIEAKYKKQLDSLRSEKDHDKAAEIRGRLAPYFAEMNEADFSFFKKHPSSRVTVYMLRFHVRTLSMARLQAYYDELGAAQQQTNAGKYLANEIQKLQGGSPGSMANNFTTIDIEGKPLRLSDYRGKYVLLDFWASWCVPCRKGNPLLKELYARYKDKGIEFIGISDDDRNPDAWKKAVEKDSLPWKHVLRAIKSANGQSTDILENYGIQSLPTKILIDPNGKIIGRYGSEGDDLDKKLDELFKKN